VRPRAGGRFLKTLRAASNSLAASSLLPVSSNRWPRLLPDDGSLWRIAAHGAGGHRQRLSVVRFGGSGAALALRVRTSLARAPSLLSYAKGWPFADRRL